LIDFSLQLFLIFRFLRFQATLCAAAKILPPLPPAAGHVNNLADGRVVPCSDTIIAVAATAAFRWRCWI
jgi:hypothetical protein